MTLGRRDFCLLAASSAYGEAPRVRMIEPDGEARRWWTRWRGPSGQGIVESTGYPDRWSGFDRALWKTEVPGKGNSSPTIWRDRIFLTTAEDGPKRQIVCYDRGTGKLLWRATAPDAAAEKLYWKNTYASSTPITDGERVYAYFGNAGVLAVDLNGKFAWHCPLGVITLYHGPGGSPLLYKNRLILYQDQRQDSFIVAIDTATGKIVWKTAREERVGWGTPIAIDTGSRHEIIVSSQDRVTAYDPGTGKLLWWARGNTFETTPTPVVGDNLLFCASGRAGPTLAIRPGGSGDVTDTHIAWQTPRGSPFIPSPLYHSGRLYTVNDMAAIATCFEAATGKVLWQGRLGQAKNEGFSASPVWVEGRVYFTNDDGEVFVLAAGDKFELLHVNDFGERVLASPALVEGKWYWRTEKHLVAIGKG
jgi:outer membrane protein assembly factor BamB